MSLFGPTDDIQLYRESFENTWEDSDSIDKVRFVVVDCETTGLDAQKDSIVTIGAVTVQQDQILLEEQFESMLKVAYNTAAVTIHGVTREETEQGGVEEPEALKAFLSYLKDGVIVGHHIGFDVEILSARCQRRFGFPLRNRWIDTMELTLHLDDAGYFGPADEHKNFSLDGLCRRFSVVPHGRHTAGGDAFITAQIFLKLLRLARKNNRLDLKSLSERYEEQ